MKSYNSYYDNSADNIKSKNYSRIADSTLFGDTDSYYILNANKQLKDKEKLEKADVAFNNTNTAAIEQLLNNRAITAYLRDYDDGYHNTFYRRERQRSICAL